MWYKAAKVSDIKDGAAQVVPIDGKTIALFNLKGKFFALDNVCPHRGGPLAQGYVDGTIVTCPLHAWEFDVTNGECKTMHGPTQKTYPIKIEKDEVLIEI